MPWGPFSDIEIMEIPGYIPNLDDEAYLEQLQKRMADRVKFVQSCDTLKDGFDQLPAEALEALEKVVAAAHK